MGLEANVCPFMAFLIAGWMSSESWDRVIAGLIISLWFSKRIGPQIFKSDSFAARETRNPDAFTLKLLHFTGLPEITLADQFFIVFSVAVFPQTLPLSNMNLVPLQKKIEKPCPLLCGAWLWEPGTSAGSCLSFRSISKQHDLRRDNLTEPLSTPKSIHERFIIQYFSYLYAQS